MARIVKRPVSHSIAHEPSDVEIRIRSYQIWEHEGCPDGKAQEHWLQAKQELTGKAAQAKTAVQAKKAEASEDKTTKSPAPRTGKGKTLRQGAPAG